MKSIALFILALGVSGASALAQDLVYTPVNPSFGGNPLNSSHLLGTANAQRERTARDSALNNPSTAEPGDDTADTTEADLFVRQLEGRLLSALAGQVTEAIFGDNPQDSGTVIFGTTTVTFNRDVGEIRLTIIDAIDGSVTEIVVPQLIVS